MAAAPKPKPDVEPADAPPSTEPSGNDAEGWELLEALRRRVDEQAAQGRATQQKVTQLADSIAALVEIQRRRTRGLNLNSFVAYLIFTILCGTGAVLLYQNRANELVSARDRAERERDVATQRADDAAAAADARERADQGAWDVYQLLEAGKRTEAIAKLNALGDLPLSRTERAVLAARAHETQVMEVRAALDAAAASFKAGRHADVIAPLEAALAGAPAANPHAASIRYFLGVAYAKGGQLDKAVPLLEGAVGSEHTDARFHLASALDRSGAYARARAEYDRFATAQPKSPLAVYAMRRSAVLARMPATAPPRAAGAAAPPAPRPRPAAPAANAPATSAPPAASAPAATPGTTTGANATTASPAAGSSAPPPSVTPAQP